MIRITTDPKKAATQNKKSTASAEFIAELSFVFNVVRNPKQLPAPSKTEHSKVISTGRKFGRLGAGAGGRFGFMFSIP